MNKFSKRLKVVFFLPDLTGGGAERIVLTFLKLLDRDYFEPVLFVCSRSGALVDSVPDDIPIRSLEKKSRFSFPLLLWRFRKQIRLEQPHIVISFWWYADAIQLLAGNNSGAKKIVSFHYVPASISRERFGSLKTWLMRRIYHRADRILAITNSLASEIGEHLLRGNIDNILVQPNPFEFSEIHRKANLQNPPWPVPTGQRLICVGRLDQIKGIDLLLRAVAALPTGSPWHLKILGEGPEEVPLKKLVKSLNLESSVSFEGFIKNPFPDIASADILVLSSLYEAFPSVLIEAMSLQTATVSFDCPSGPAQIIFGDNGMLVAANDVLALRDAIAKLLANPSYRDSLVSRATERIGDLEAAQVVRILQQNLQNTYNMN